MAFLFYWRKVWYRTGIAVFWGNKQLQTGPEKKKNQSQKSPETNNNCYADSGMELKPSWSCVQFLGATNHPLLFWIQFNLNKFCLIWLQASAFQSEEKIQGTWFGTMGANVASIESRLNSEKKQFERLHGMAWTFTYHGALFSWFFFLQNQ